jgi:hypothetical protein
MPLIPRAAEQVRMQSSAPVQIASTGDARIPGEAIAAFGKGVEKAGAEYMQFQKQQEAFAEQNKSDEFANEVHNVSLKAHEYAKTNSSEDGADFGDKFYEAAQPAYDEAMNKYAGNNPRLREKFSSYLNRVKSDADTSIAINSGAMMEEHNYKTLDKTSVDAANRVMQNPKEEMAVAEIQAFGKSLDAHVAAGNFSAEKADKIRKVHYQRVAMEFVNGLEDKKQPGKALAFLKANQTDANMFTQLDPAQARSIGLIDSREEQALVAKGETYKVPTLSKKDGVKLTPELTEAMNSLDPLDKAHLIDRVSAKLQEQVAVKLSDVNAEMNGFEQIAMTGGLGANAEGTVAKLKASINAAPGMSLSAKRRAMDRINTASVIDKQLKVAAITPRSQLTPENFASSVAEKIHLASASAAQIDPRMGEVDYAIQANREESLARATKAIEQIQKKQDSDGAGVMVSSDKDSYMLYKAAQTGGAAEFKNYATTVLNKQNHLGFAKPSLIPKDDAAAIAQTMKAAPDADTMNMVIGNLEQKFGEYMPQVMEEIAAQDKSLADYKMISMVPMHQRQPLLDGIKNDAGIVQQIKEDKTLSSRSKEAGEEITSLMGNFNKALMGGRNDSSSVNAVNSMQNLANIQARRAILRGEDPEKAAKDAYNTVVAGNFSLVTGGKSTVLIPRQIQNGDSTYEIGPKQERLFKTFMHVYSSAEGFRELGVRIPDAYNKGQLDWENETRIGGIGNYPENPIRNYYNALSENSRWVTNDSQTGMLLVELRTDGSSVPVMDKYGKRVERSYKDIFISTPKSVIDADKTFVAKLFGG